MRHTTNTPANARAMHRFLASVIIACTAAFAVSSSHARPSSGSERLQDSQTKATRGAAAVLDGQRRSYSGPTERLRNTMRDRVMGITTGRGRK